MQIRQPLSRRIMIAFTLMAALVAGLFSLGLTLSIHYVERQLVSSDLRRELSTVIDQDLDRGLPPRLHSSTRFHASHLSDYAIPERFMDLDEGFSEVLHDGRAYHVLRREIDGNSYLLVQDQQGFQERENALLRIVSIGFVLSVLLAALLGSLLARQVIAPVIKLANQVRHRDQLLPTAPPLAPDYVADEVGRLAEAFDHTLQRLREALQREQLFTADISHELRTPLTIIATSCELLTEATPPESEQQRQLARIRRACADIGELLDTFLTLARGLEDSAQASSTLDAIAREQYRHWQAAMLDKGLSFQLIHEGHDEERYNTTLVRTVMANLLRNALHYTQSGSVHLVLESGGFRVEDTGSGVEPAQRELIFEAFTRGNPMRGEGLGLGLSLVKRICHSQGWQVSLRDAPGGGSTFRIRLR